MPFAKVLAHLGGNPRLFGGTALALLAMSFATFGMMAWIPSFFVRAHGMSFAQAGQLIAGGVLVFAGTGARVAGIVSERLRRLGWRDSMMIVCISSSLVVAALVVFMALVPSRSGAEALACAAFFFVVMPSTLGGAVLLQISPPSMQARVLAIQLFLVQLVGLGLGPTAVALLTDRLSHNEAAVGLSIAITCAGSAIVATAAFLWSRALLLRKIAHEERAVGAPIAEI
jgi:hypothetical protein